jgi:hypothetical protein
MIKGSGIPTPILFVLTALNSAILVRHRYETIVAVILSIALLRAAGLMTV